MKRDSKKPLYRKENTRARNHHRVQHHYRYQRNTKGEDDPLDKRGSMHGKSRKGRDYTPLFRFLLGRVGRDWDAIHSEATSRLDREDPIFWLVALHEADGQPYVRIGESSLWSGLYVDDENVLQRVDPELGPESFRQECHCCTLTFNGTVVPPGAEDNRGRPS